MLVARRWVPGLWRRLLEGPGLLRGQLCRGQGQTGAWGGVVGRWIWSGRAASCDGHPGRRPVEGEVGPDRRLVGVGSVRLLKGVAGGGTRKGRLSGKHYQLNQQITAADVGGGAVPLFEIVRMRGGDGGPEALDFAHVNCSNWLNKLVKGDAKDLRGKAPVEVVQVLGRTLFLLRETPALFRPREVAILANAAAQLHYSWEDGKRLHMVLLEELKKWVGEREAGMGDFKAIDIANFINGFAKVGFNPGKTVLVMVVTALLALDKETIVPQDLSNVANGFARLGIHPGKPLMDMIAGECVRRALEGFSAQATANIVNSFARLEALPRGDLLTVIARECVRRTLEDFNQQEIANLAHAFAKFAVHPGEELLDMISEECVRRGLGGFSEQAIANIASSFARFKYTPKAGLLAVIRKECARRRLEGFTGEAVANLASALATLRYHPGEELLGMVMERCHGASLAGFDQLDLALVLHALALLHCVPSDEWMAGFRGRCEELGWEEFNQGTRVRILWSCAALGVPLDKGLVEAVSASLRKAKVYLDKGATDRRYRISIKQCRAVRQVVFLSGPSDDQALQELGEAAEAMWEVVRGSDMIEPPTESGLQQGVFSILESKWETVESEVTVGDLLSLDAVITLPCGAKVGVEVDGAPHFFHNQPDVPTGSTLLKRRMLDRSVELGWLQGWVAVHNASPRELAKVEEAVRRVEVGAM